MSGNQQSDKIKQTTQSGENGRTKIPSTKDGVLYFRALVANVEGPAEGKVGDIMRYSVTGYKYAFLKRGNAVNWDIKINGKQEKLAVSGEHIDLKIKEE